MKNKPSCLIILIVSFVAIASGLTSIFNFEQLVKNILVVLGILGTVYSIISSELDKSNMAFELDELAATIASAGLGNKYLRRLQKELKDKGFCNINKAHNLLYSALELNPKDLEALGLLSASKTLNLCYRHSFLRKNVLNKSIYEIRRITNAGLKIDPKNPGLHIDLGMLYDIEADHEKARLLFKKAGGYVDGYYWHLAMSTSYLMSEDYEQGLNEIETAIQKGAKGSMVDFYYGRALYATGDYEKAAIYLNRVYKIHPNNTQVLSTYSDVFYYQGNFIIAALISFRLSCILFLISPSNSFIKLIEATVAIGLGLVCKISKLIWPITRHIPLLSRFQLKLVPPDQPEVALSKKMIKKGHFNAAVRLLRKATAICPQNISTLNDLAASLISIGQTEDAIKTFDLAISMDPTNKYLLYNKDICQKGIYNKNKINWIDPKDFK